MWTQAELDTLQRELPAEMYHCRGQLSHYDRLIYYWAARTFYSGFGTIVDAGALIGGTAKLMAFGLTQNPRVTHEPGRILSYDRFEDREGGYMAQAISQFQGIQLPPAHNGIVDFEPVFRFNTAAFADSIQVRRGDIAKLGYSDARPIEILSVDVGKTADLMRCVARDFFPRLVPGASIVLNQDYVFPLQPWVIVAMELLADHFEQHELPTECTMVHRCTKPLTAELVGARLGDSGSAYFTRENVPLIGRARDRLREPGNRAALHAAEAYALLLLGDVEAAKSAASALVRDHELSASFVETRLAFGGVLSQLGITYS
jgi:hypothetical protein